MLVPGADEPLANPTLYALRSISGKYQGGEFPIRPDKEIVVGRASDLDMVLVEDMVSRKHARIVAGAEDIHIQDLGSTNGTFVNGEKVKTAKLKEGDRILIGTSIIRLVAASDTTAAISDETARQRLEQTGQKRQMSGSTGKPMSGSIDEIPLPDLLQLLSTSRKSGVLSVKSEEGTGRIYMRKGQIYYATINESYDLQPRKVAFRILTWVSGTFELGPADEKSVLEEIQESTEALLMEGMRQLDEYQRISKDLPGRNQQIVPPQPMQPLLRDLKPNELDVWQLALSYGKLRPILDRSPQTDYETGEVLILLIKRGYLQIRG